MTNKPETAHALMIEHKMNCAQTVLSAFCADMGLDRETALKVASAFGGGMGRTGHRCGAVTGAYMVLGLSQPIDRDNPRASLDKMYELVKAFNQKFTVAHGSLTCKDLIHCDLSTPEGFAEMKSKELHISICSGLVADSARIVSELVQPSGPQSR